jgi:nucleoside-diphosphate-sugar epimerase
MKNNIYNVGSDEMNYSKREICEKIGQHVKHAYFNYADVGEDVDKRNYQVSYEKISKLGFHTIHTVDEGIAELVKAAPIISINSPYHNVFL